MNTCLMTISFVIITIFSSVDPFNLMIWLMSNFLHSFNKYWVPTICWALYYWDLKVLLTSYHSYLPRISNKLVKIFTCLWRCSYSSCLLTLSSTPLLHFRNFFSDVNRSFFSPQMLFAVNQLVFLRFYSCLSWLTFFNCSKYSLSLICFEENYYKHRLLHLKY